MSNKTKVLKKYPRAFSHRFADKWCVFTPYVGGNQCIGGGVTAVQAWSDARKNLKQFSWLKP